MDFISAHLLNFGIYTAGAVWALVFTPKLLRSLRDRTGSAGVVGIWTAAAAYLIPNVLAPVAGGPSSELAVRLAKVFGDGALALGLWEAAVFVLALCLGYVRLTSVSRNLLLLWLAIVVASLISGQDPRDTVSVLGTAALIAASRLDITRALWHFQTALRIVVLGSLAYWIVNPGAVVGDAGLGRRTIFGVPQLFGITSNPNSLGPLAAAALAIELTNPAKRKLRALFAFAALFCVIFAQSRNGWVAAVVAVAAAIWSRAGGKSGLLVRTGLLVSSSFAVIWLFLTVGAGQSGDNLTTGRTEIWSGLIPMVWSSPVIGHGAGVLSEDNRTQFGGVIALYAGQAHNQFLETALESGAVGLILLVLLIVSAAVWAARSVERFRPTIYALLSVVSVSLLVESPLRPTFTGVSILVLGVLAMASAPHSPTGEALAETPLLVGAGRPRKRAY